MNKIFQLGIIKWGILLGIGISIFFSIYFSYVKFLALGYEHFDFAFYLQFAAKLSDPQLIDQYSTNPNGRNFLYFAGPEGYRHFHQAIHFEPIKYVFVVAYYLFKSPISVFTVFGVLYFLPLVYITLIFPLHTAQDRMLLLFTVGIFTFYPSTFKTISWDLRPYIFLAPGLMFALVAIVFRRPLWERVFGLMFLLLAREESLILGSCVVAYNFLSEMRQKRNSSKTTTVLGGMLIAWGLITVSYYRWAHYSLNISAKMLERVLYVKRTPVIPMIFVCLLLIGVVAISRYWTGLMKKMDHRVNRFLPVIVFSFCIIPLTMEFLYYFKRELHDYQHPQLLDILKFVFHELLWAPRYTLYAVVVLLVAILVWEAMSSAERKKHAWIMTMTGILLLIMAVPSLVFIQRSFSTYRHQFDKYSSLVFNARNSTDKYADYILCDRDTYQAFFDYNHIFVYNKIPCYLLKNCFIEWDNLFYPRNLPMLQQLVTNDIQYIVTSQKNMNVMRQLLERSGKKWNVIEENAQYVWMAVKP